MSLDPQAAELVLRLRRAGVVGPSQLTVAGARREGLKIGGIWLLDSQSLAIMAHLNRNDRSTTTEVATGAGLEVKVAEDLLGALRSSGFARRREDANGEGRWVSLVSGRRRASKDTTGVLALLGDGDDAVGEDEALPDGTRHYQVGPDVWLRIYRPEASGERDLPVVYFIHGGGYVTGSVEQYNEVCQATAELVGCAVASVEYRLAPEHPFPVAFEDVVAGLRWLVDQADSLRIDRHRMAVMGDSVGGALSTSLSFLAERQGWARFLVQILLYPALDTSMAQPSYHHHADGPLVSAADMAWYYGHYNAPPEEPTSSPLSRSDLHGAAPALIFTAENDPMHDDGGVYAERLRAAGNEVEHVECAGVFHGFYLFAPTLDAATRARERVAEELIRRLTPRVVSLATDPG
ncbi:MAG: alpha/beta hydrolase [Thermoleophilia bacterium]